MKRYISILAAMLLTLLLASCGSVNEKQDEEVSTLPENTDVAALTASIARAIEIETEEKAVGIFIDDYNHDGEPCAYALTSSQEQVEELPYIPEATLWFVKGDTAEPLIFGNIGKAPSIFDFDDKKLICADVYQGDSISSSVFFVAGKHAYSYGNFDGQLVRSQSDKNVFYLIKSELDADYNMKRSEFERATQKPYYLYFDGNFFCEYGGSLLREDQLRSVQGADAILTAISEGGYILDTIYARGNGIFNINISKNVGDGIVLRENITLHLTDGVLTVIPVGTPENPLANVDNIALAGEIVAERFASPEKFSYSGSYIAAAIPDIASYQKIGE